MKKEVEIIYSGVLSYIVEADTDDEAIAKAQALYDSGEPDHNSGCHDESVERFMVQPVTTD
jgi:hypothetical protein